MSAAKEVEVEEPPSPNSKRIKAAAAAAAAAAPMNVDLKVRATWKTSVSVNPTDSIRHVKEIIGLKEGSAIDRIIVSADGIEQPDTQTDLSHLSDLSVEIRQFAQPLRIIVVYPTPSKMKLRTIVVVDGEDKLWTLRSLKDFWYPTTPFKFLHRFKLLDEDTTFIDNGFQDCDEVRILHHRRGGMAPLHLLQ